jgi:hypothetical protein
MAPSKRSLLPPPSQLAKLSDEQTKSALALIDNESRRANTYAIVGMVCGTLSFLGCLGSYVYLVTQHHDQAAGVVLGATVLAIVGRMIRGK